MSIMSYLLSLIHGILIGLSALIVCKCVDNKKITEGVFEWFIIILTVVTTFVRIFILKY